MSFRSTIAPLLMLGAIAPLAACDRQSPAPEQADATAAARPRPVPAASPTPAPAATPALPKEGERVIVDTIGTLDRSHKGEAAPAVSFQGLDGGATSIAAFAGKPVLLNLWATWCQPCIKEMPTLDVAARGITVVAVSQDLDGAAKVTPFLARGGFSHLKPYLDTKLMLSTAYQAVLPTNILYDSRGREVWRMSGGMDWTTQTARDLLAEAR